MRVIFCGTPEIAVPSLEALSEIAEIVGVVCQPDRPAGRGMKLHPPAVKVAAQGLGLSVFQPVKVKDGTLSHWMRQRQADVALVIAYGRILNEETLSTPRLGCVNLHASLLPEYRGAAPIQRAIMDDRKETGVCLMQMDEGMDTGPVLARRTLAIAPEDDTGTLARKLGALAATLTKEELPRFVNGELTPQVQDHDLASYAPPIGPDDQILDFSRPAVQLAAQIRGLAPRPGAYCFVDPAQKKRFKIKAAAPLARHRPLAPGQVEQAERALLIGTGEGALVVRLGQVEGKKEQSGEELLRGRALNPGQVLSGRTS